MSVQGSPAAAPTTKDTQEPKTFTWAEILDRLLALDKRLRKLEEAETSDQHRKV